MWSINIVAAHDDGRDLEALTICFDIHFRSCFGCRIGVCREKERIFQQIFSVVFDFSIHFIG
jgi:hypothetical protein